MKEVTNTIRTKVVEWNNQCALINSSLFLADHFNPKPIPNASNAEVVFWYDITNLYALFSDCMPYLLKAGTTFNRTQFKLNSASTLINLLQGKGFLGVTDIKLITSFDNVIKEARSCFCHNKPLSTFDEKKITNGFAHHPDYWRFYSYLGCANSFDFDQGSELLYAKANLVISTIDKALKAAKENCTDALIQEWSQSIAAWYMSSNDIIFRGLLLYKNSRKIVAVSKGFDRMCTDAINTLAINRKTTPENLIKDIHTDLTDEIIYSSAIATPENILYKLFDSFI